MGRTRSFDETTVVVDAARTFVASGYEATSIDVLVTATGLLRGSLYGAFGSKRGLFIAALRLGDGDLLTTTEKIDLLLVALLELAPSDTTVRGLAGLQLSRLEGPAALVLGGRLIERAGVTPSSEIVTDDTTREAIS